MRFIPRVADKKVAVFGLARSGLSVAQALKRSDAHPLCWDDSPEARRRAIANGLELRDFRNPDSWGDVDLMIVSPGIPHLYPRIAASMCEGVRRGIAMDNDIGLFFRMLDRMRRRDSGPSPLVVAVTGSNGKSTTVSLIEHMARTGGLNCRAAGNIGQGVFGFAMDEYRDLLVLELSSYQCELASALYPDVGVFLNFSADHLDRHDGRGGYLAAKRRMLNSWPSNQAIVGVDEAEGMFLASTLASHGAPVVRISTDRPPGGEGRRIWSSGGKILEADTGEATEVLDLRDSAVLSGRHNHQNVCAALAVGRAIGLDIRAIRKGIETFEGLPHRCQAVAVVNGVRFINDSKATNAVSAANALQSFDRIHWIAGGRGKEGGINAVRSFLGNVRKVYLIGESAQDFEAELAGVPTEICHDMERAFDRTLKDARKGDTVLLSPAAASFDQYADFEERGDHFIRLARAYSCACDSSTEPEPSKRETHAT